MIPNCLIADLNRCLECNPGFILNEAGGCLKNVKFCSAYDTLSNCIRCIQPYQISQGQCYILNCASYNQERICTSCRIGFGLVTNNNGIITCEARVPNCLAYYPETSICLECQPRYYLQNDLNQCFPVSPLCIQYSKTTNTCYNCIEGYYPINGICTQPNIPNCKRIGNFICLQCYPGFILVNDFCIIQKQQQIPHCFI